MQPSYFASHAARLLLALCCMLCMVSCATPPAALEDDDLIPVGSRINFWVYHDEHGWRESNIHIAALPRLMTGSEARRWAEGVGNRDGGLRWTHYYLLVTHPEPPRRRYRSRIHHIGPHAAPYRP